MSWVSKCQRRDGVWEEEVLEREKRRRIKGRYFFIVREKDFFWRKKGRKKVD